MGVRLVKIHRTVCDRCGCICVDEKYGALVRRTANLKPDAPKPGQPPAGELELCMGCCEAFKAWMAAGQESLPELEPTDPPADAEPEPEAEPKRRESLDQVPEWMAAERLAEVQERRS